MLQYQTTTLLVALGTLGLTILLYVFIPKGFFPIEDTGVIQGITEAPQSVSFPEMAVRQKSLAKIILNDPAVESLSSFIGIDGTNTTLNSGRIQINLKPREDRDALAMAVIQRLQTKLEKVAGITLYNAAGSGSHGGRSCQPNPVSIHAGRPEPGGTEHLRSTHAGKVAAIARVERCRH